MLSTENEHSQDKTLKLSEEEKQKKIIQLAKAMGLPLEPAEGEVEYKIGVEIDYFLLFDADLTWILQLAKKEIREAAEERNLLAGGKHIRLALVGVQTHSLEWEILLAIGTGIAGSVIYDIMRDAYRRLKVRFESRTGWKHRDHINRMSIKLKRRVREGEIEVEDSFEISFR